MAGQTIAKPRGEKSQRYVFFLGVALAAIAAILVFVAVSGSEGGSTSATVPVVVASQDIPAQTRVTNEMVKLDFVSPDEAVANAFTARSQLVDRVVIQQIPAGTQIVPAMVSVNAGDGLAFKVEPGMRGVSVEVREVVTAGGNIKPGDRVDVIGVFEVSGLAEANELLSQFGTGYTISRAPATSQTADAQAGEEAVSQTFILTATLLQNVKVLGLAQSLTPDTAGGVTSADATEVDSQPRASTATVEVTPAQAQMLTTADEYGILRMDARSAGDDAAGEVAPTLIVVDKVG